MSKIRHFTHSICKPVKGIFQKISKYTKCKFLFARELHNHICNIKNTCSEHKQWQKLHYQSTKICRFFYIFTGSTYKAEKNKHFFDHISLITRTIFKNVLVPLTYYFSSEIIKLSLCNRKPVLQNLCSCCVFSLN